MPCSFTLKHQISKRPGQLSIIEEGDSMVSGLLPDKLNPKIGCSREINWIPVEMRNSHGLVIMQLHIIQRQNPWTVENAPSQSLVAELVIS